MKTPVALFGFNRPDFSTRVFELVRRAQPSVLMLVADGPRTHVPDDAEKCARVRALADRVDWRCELHTNFAESNMGSFSRNSSGISWVFDTVEEAILLEDDCIPALSFFQYAEELLGRYRDDQRIAVISGNNFLRDNGSAPSNTYFFSAYALTWGWASWRRFWRRVDLTMPQWTDFRDSGNLRSVVRRADITNYWTKIYDEIALGVRRNAWDYQVILTCLINGYLNIIPSRNLVTNIGNGPDATHCNDPHSLIAHRPTHELSFPLVHPLTVVRDSKLDTKVFFSRFRENRILRLAKRLPFVSPLLARFLGEAV